jgi:polar amino acid transport system substrate-binding protein
MVSGAIRGRAATWLVVAIVAVAACSSSSATQSPAGSAGASPGASTAGGSLPASATIDKVKKAGSLRVGVAPALPWLGQDPKTNEYFGAATILAKAMADKLGVKLEYVPQDFSVIVAALQSDKIDIADAPLFATPQRLQVIEIAPWASSGECYLVLKTNTKVKTTADLNNPDVKITGLQGTGSLQSVQAKYPKASYVIVAGSSGQEADFLDVLNGKADAAIIDSPVAPGYAAKYTDLKVLPDDCQDNSDVPTAIGVGYSKGDDGWSTFIKNTIAELQPQLDAAITQYSTPQYLNPQ